MSDKKLIAEYISQLFEDLYFSASNAADIQLSGQEKEGARKIAKALASLEKDKDVRMLLDYGDPDIS
jgi:hypothetical protein